MSRRRTALMTVAVLVLGLAPASAGESGWRPPKVLVADDFVTPAVLATDRDERGIAVYVSNAFGPAGDELRARRITASGALRTPVTLASRGVITSYDVAVDDDGDAVVVWQEPAEYPVQWQVFARRLSRTGRLGPVVRVSDKAETSDSPQVAVTPGGVATIVYRRGGPTSNPATAVLRLNRRSNVTRRAYLPATGQAGTPVASRSGHVSFGLTATSAGVARAVRVDPDGDIHVRRLTRDLPGSSYGTGGVGVDRRGNVYAVIRGKNSQVWVRTWRRDGSLGAARKVAPRRKQAFWLLIRTDLEGDSIVLWASYAKSGGWLRVFARSWQGRLGPVVRLGRMDGPVHVNVHLPSWSAAVDDDGDGVLAWERHIDGEDFLRVARVTRAGRFTAVRKRGRGASPDVASTPSGRLLLAYYRDESRYSKLLLRTRP
jgi:hypothetical protein